jgi:hypothetical protein
VSIDQGNRLLSIAQTLHGNPYAIGRDKDLMLKVLRARIDELKTGMARNRDHLTHIEFIGRIISLEEVFSAIEAANQPS